MAINLDGLIEKLAATVAAHADEMTALDSAIGDADLGGAFHVHAPVVGSVVAR